MLPFLGGRTPEFRWSFYSRDHWALRTAAQRTINLNPLDSTIMAVIGRLLAFSSDWSDGLKYAQRAMDLNPDHPRWYKLPSLFDAYRQGRYEEALQTMHLKLPDAHLIPAFLAATLGKLGRAAEARSAIESIANTRPEMLDPERVRATFATAFWDAELPADIVDGFNKAKTLADSSS